MALEPEPAIEAHEWNRDRPKEETQPATHVVMDVAVDVESLYLVHRVEGSKISVRASQVAGCVGVSGKISKPDRREIVETQAPHVEGAQRNDGKVIFHPAVELGVAPELLGQVPAQVRATRRRVPPNRQVVSQGATDRIDQVVASKQPEPLFPETGDPPESEVPPESRRADVDVATQRRSPHDRELARSPVEGQAGTQHSHVTAMCRGLGDGIVDRYLLPGGNIEQLQLAGLVDDLVEPP